VIGDLYPPLNPGEQNTVRLVMNVEEARRLATELTKACGKLRKHETNAVPSHTRIEDLRHILRWALADEQTAQRKARRKAKGGR
jgi:hypothetical protein